MILVDSSVWIDDFRGAATAQVDRLDTLIDREPLAIGDLILTEVLQGFSVERDFERALRLLSPLILIEIGGREVALQAARNVRLLRVRGGTVRKTIDTLIRHPMHPERGLTLLYGDRDFDPFVEQLGLRSAYVAR